MTQATSVRGQDTCVPHSVLTCINGRSGYWPGCDPSQDKNNGGPDGYEFGHYCTQRWADALNEMLSSPEVGKCGDRDATHKVLAEIAYETGYFSTVYQPRDGGAGLIHMIPGNWPTNAADMEALWPGTSYVATAAQLGKAFFQDPAYGWRSVAAWYKRTNRVIPGCGMDLFDEPFETQTRCILSRVVDRSEAFSIVGDCLAAAPGPEPAPVVPAPKPEPTPEPEPSPESEPTLSPPLPLECQAVQRPGISEGATDERCTRACSSLTPGSWPCKEDDLCVCTVATTDTTTTAGPATTTSAPTTTTASVTTPVATTTASTAAATTPVATTTASTAAATTPVATTTASSGKRVCLHNKNCGQSAWCNSNNYEAWCAASSRHDPAYCPQPYCVWGSEGKASLATFDGGVAIRGPCTEGGCLPRSNTSSLLQLRSHRRVATFAMDGAEAAAKDCQAVPNAFSATDALCASTCRALPQGMWPCGEGGPCVCNSGGNPTPAPATPAPTTTAPVPAPATTAMPNTSAALTPAPVPGEGGPGLLDATVRALQSANSAGVFLYNTGTTWMESDLYTWADMIKAVQGMASTGVGKAKLWLGEGEKHVYGLVNIAAFLAQCMQETIQYNACDENNWSDRNVVAEAGGSTYSATSACGQLHQSYQHYTCSAEEDALAGGQMACPVDNDMEMRALTQAQWYGAPPKLFCAPRSKLPKAPRWDFTQPWCAPPGGWGHVEPFSNSSDFATYLDYVKGGGSCKDYPGIKTGGWSFEGEGCQGGACPGSAAPLFGVPEGRTDVEGCCWWGRGVIQTTGVCNFGKLNFFLGKRAAQEGRAALYPDIDFCSNPGAICEPGKPPELKWVAGFFYWLNAVQPYQTGSWNYLGKLKRWVDGGMDLSDASFIDGASGIVNRGCHNPPNCGTGELHARSERQANFQKVLRAMGLAGR